jgi:catechol 2,3-dioxygenase-like lactoylglutathione lyase family enzyme
MPATPQIKQMATVFVPVSDQDRSLEFYVEKLGFEKRTDFTYADGRRWVEVVPPGAETSIALVPPQDGGPVGIETHIALTSDNVDAAHDRLAGLGVDVNDVMHEGDPVVYWSGVVLAGIPPMFLFRDPDGNSLLMG